MKILYAIQGTGNGHLSRAIEIAPFLKKKGDVDILVSGIQSDIQLPFKIDHSFYGLSFIFGKNGGVDLLNTYRKSKLKELYREIKKFPIKKYDLIISDFEPVSCWASYFGDKTAVGLSNQAAVLAPGSPQPSKIDPIGKMVLKHYAPCAKQYGFHFARYNSNIYTPIIRQEIRNLKTTDKGHYVVYLPSYSDEKILKRLKQFKDIDWQIFSKHTKRAYTDKNCSIFPINKDHFMKSFASCSGILCGAGFATPSEALFLDKKLMVVPMKSQYEQQCNAMALKNMGVSVMKSLKKKHLPKIEKWLYNYNKAFNIDYPDETALIIDRIIDENVR
jgi:uncharacterized protein (TIGR00661 family)